MCGIHACIFAIQKFCVFYIKLCPFSDRHYRHFLITLGCILFLYFLYKQRVKVEDGVFFQFSFIVDFVHFNGFSVWGKRTLCPWWDVMLVTGCSSLHRLYLIPRRSVFKLLLSEVALMGGGSSYTQSSFANVFKRAALCSAYWTPAGGITTFVKRLQLLTLLCCLLSAQ